MKTLVQQPGRIKLVSFAFTKSPEWQQHEFGMSWMGKTMSRSNCETTGWLEGNMAFWVHLGLFRLCNLPEKLLKEAWKHHIFGFR